MTEESPTPVTDVDRVIDALARRVVPVADRFRLGKALDTANAPPAGRQEQDEAANRAIGRAHK